MSANENAPLPVEGGEELQPLPLVGPADELQPLPIAGADELEPLPVEEASVTSQRPSRIQAFGSAAADGPAEHQFARKTNLTGRGAVRCRFFHSKITIPAIDHMVQTINEWLDGDKVEAKQVCQTVGVMEGKKPEPNLIVIVWY
jgi:hypothetical protein